MLTKSDYIRGLQCEKLLWINKNDKEKIIDSDLVHDKFEIGRVVGEYAKSLFPSGVDLSIFDFNENILRTKEFLERRVPLFEAGFIVDDLYSRCDVLVPALEDEWDIIEVKSSTDVEDVYIHDVSFQKYVCEKFGLKIRACYIMHINNQYIRDGEIEPSELFTKIDVTENVFEFSEGISERVFEMLRIINFSLPEKKIGEFCFKPYNCPMIYECHREILENSVFDLKGIRKKKAFELHHSGVRSILDITDDIKLNEKQKIQRIILENGGVHFDERNVKNFINNLNYPLYYLDFETIQFAVPKFNLSKPYQQIPFQYSLHIQNEPGGEIIHKSFLMDGDSDPRILFLQSLKENLGEMGDILVYNQRFEKMILRESVEIFSDFLGWHDENILPRIKDLMVVFENFWYYDSRQNGSVSIKKVLPIFSDLKYDNLEIRKGDVASREFGRITYSDVTSQERARVRGELEKYCELDTLAEVEIVEGLRKLVSL